MPESIIENGHNDEVHLSSDEKKYCTDLQNFELNKTEEIECKESPIKAKFQPKVPPTDYERFIYKCQYCMLGFKRRGNNLIVKKKKKIKSKMVIYVENECFHRYARESHGKETSRYSN